MNQQYSTTSPSTVYPHMSYQFNNSPFQSYNNLSTESFSSGYGSDYSSPYTTTSYTSYTAYNQDYSNKTPCLVNRVKVNAQSTPVYQSTEIVLSENEDNSDDSNSEGENAVDDGRPRKKKRVLTSTQRQEANKRERKRVGIMNDAFDQLRNHVPINSGRKRRKVSRLDIVTGAIDYIQYLDSLLQKDGPPGPIDFDSYLRSLYYSL